MNETVNELRIQNKLFGSFFPEKQHDELVHKIQRLSPVYVTNLTGNFLKIVEIKRRLDMSAIENARTDAAGVVNMDENHSISSTELSNSFNHNQVTREECNRVYALFNELLIATDHCVNSMKEYTETLFNSLSRPEHQLAHVISLLKSITGHFHEGKLNNDTTETKSILRSEVKALTDALGYVLDNIPNESHITTFDYYITQVELALAVYYATQKKCKKQIFQSIHRSKSSLKKQSNQLIHLSPQIFWN